MLERRCQAVHEVEVDLAGQEIAREAEHRPREVLELGWRQVPLDGGGEVLEVTDVAYEVGSGLTQRMALVERARCREDEPRQLRGPPVGLGDETTVALSRRLLHVVVHAVVHREAVTQRADRPRRRRVVEPGDTGRPEPAGRARYDAGAESPVDGAADPVPLPSGEDVERFAHGHAGCHPLAAEESPRPASGDRGRGRA